MVRRQVGRRRRIRVMEGGARRRGMEVLEEREGEREGKGDMGERKRMRMGGRIGTGEGEMRRNTDVQDLGRWERERRARPKRYERTIRRSCRLGTGRGAFPRVRSRTKLSQVLLKLVRSLFFRSLERFAELELASRWTAEVRSYRVKVTSKGTTTARRDTRAHHSASEPSTDQLPSLQRRSLASAQKLTSNHSLALPPHLRTRTLLQSTSHSPTQLNTHLFTSLPQPPRTLLRNLIRPNRPFTRPSQRSPIPIRRGPPTHMNIKELKARDPNRRSWVHESAK